MDTLTNSNSNANANWQSVLERLSAALFLHGLDLCHPFSVAKYNRTVVGPMKLAQWEVANNLGILVANTRALWPVFLKHLANHPDWILWPDPLDNYVQSIIENALKSFPLRYEARWDFSRDEKLLPLQHVAEVTGFATRSVSYLSIHPKYGPWISLRAALSFDIEWPSSEPVTEVKSCSDCNPDCLSSFNAAREASKIRHPEKIAEHWPLWVATRDACTTGREYRFSDEQIEYHYTKDTRRLKSFVGKVNSHAYR